MITARELADPRGLPGPWKLPRAAGAIWVQPDDLLVLNTQNTYSGVALQVNGRMWHLDGSVSEFTMNAAPAANRTLQAFTQQLSQGFLASVVVSVSGGVPARGQTLVSVAIARPPITAPTPKAVLCKGYVTAQSSLLWPFGRVIDGAEGTGYLYSPTISNPGAGSDWLARCPSGAHWRFRGGNAQLVTAAGGGNRQVAFQLSIIGTLLFTIEAANVQAGGATVIYDLLPGLPFTTLTAGHQPIPWPPDVMMTNPWQVQTLTGGIQAGDQWSAINLAVEEWQEG